MTPDQAKALAHKIAQQLREADAGFILVIQVDDGDGVDGCWHANGNNSGIAGMVASVLSGVTRQAAPTDCPGCMLAMDDMRAALSAFTPDAPKRACH